MTFILVKSQIFVVDTVPALAACEVGSFFDVANVQTVGELGGDCRQRTL